MKFESEDERDSWVLAISTASIMLSWSHPQLQDQEKPEHQELPYEQSEIAAGKELLYVAEAVLIGNYYYYLPFLQ